MHKWISNALLLLLLSPTLQSAGAETLKGTVSVDDVAVTKQLAVLKPQWDSNGLVEHCSCMNPAKVRAAEIDGRWQLVDDLSTIADFGTRKDAAEAAKAVVEHYKFVETCWAGRSQGANLAEMRYFKTRDGAPVGSMPDEDALAINPENVKAELIQGTWKVTDGDHWMLDYQNDQAAAEQARDIIHVYGFTKFCFVGKPARAMMYFKK